MSQQHFEIQWQGIEIEIRYCPSWSESYERIYGSRMAHLEVVQPGGDPLPFTETGYRSHFTPADDIEGAGGPVAYVGLWLDWAGKDPAWQAAQRLARQLVLL